MKRSILVLAGIAALAVGFVAQMPASVLAGWVESSVPGLRIGPVTGTALNGQAKRLIYEDVPLEDVEWRLHPLWLLVASAAADLRVATDAGTLEAGVAHSLLGGGLQVHDLNGIASVQWLAQRAGYTFVPVSGRIRAADTDFALNDEGILERANGDLQAEQLRWELINPPAVLGRFGAAVTTEDQTINLKITDSDGPVALAGGASLQPEDGAYDLDLRLRTRTEADDRLKRLLDELGQADDQGWYRLAQQGQL